MTTHGHDPITVIVAGLAYGHTYSLRLRADDRSGAGPVRTVSVAPMTWVTDPIAAAARRAEVAIPADPAAYRGRLAFTTATDRSHNNTVAVPLATVHGRHLGRHQAAVLSGDGLFDFNSATLTKAGRDQIHQLVASLQGDKSISCEGYTDYGGLAAWEMTLCRPSPSSLHRPHR